MYYPPSNDCLFLFSNRLQPDSTTSYFFSRISLSTHFPFLYSVKHSLKKILFYPCLIDRMMESWKDKCTTLHVRKDDSEMDLSQNTAENIEFMVTAIKEKLRMVNAGAVKPEDFNEEMYEDLHDLYVMVNRKDHFSPSEMNAIIEEMGNLRRKA